MNEVKPTILIVEDDAYYQDKYAKELGERVNIIAAYDIPTAREMFGENVDIISLIVLDACVPGKFPNTIPLARDLKELTSVPIIAASSMPQYTLQLVREGCDYRVTKDEVPGLIMRLLSEVCQANARIEDVEHITPNDGASARRVDLSKDPRNVT